VHAQCRAAAVELNVRGWRRSTTCRVRRCIAFEGALKPELVRNKINLL
jgi:hypothetical protein